MTCIMLDYNGTQKHEHDLPIILINIVLYDISKSSATGGAGLCSHRSILIIILNKDDDNNYYCYEIRGLIKV